MPNPLTLADYRAYLLGIANRSLPHDLRPKAGGSDLVQDTLLAAWTCRDRTPAEAVRAWLRGILKNRVGRLHRRYLSVAKRSVLRERPLDPHSSDPEHARHQPPDGDMIHEELCRALNDAVDQLRPQDREVLTLRLDDDLSWQEIADRLDTTAEAARKVFTRTLEQLRGLLSPHLDPAGPG